MPQHPPVPPLTAPEFDDLVLQAKLPVAIYISHKHCRFAAAARREFMIAAQDFKAFIGFFEVDADAEKALVSRLNVKGVPILLFFTTGIERFVLLGFYSSDELRKQLWSIISTGGDV